jgi:competence protein ComEA
MLLIEINGADTTQLKLLKGIGSGFAKLIVSYRRKLGGFHTKSQLLEVWGLSEEIYNQIVSQIIVDKNFIKRIPVNMSSIDRLRNHPYINFYQARAIYEYRRNEGRINSIEACKMIDDESLTEEFWKKASPYLEFNMPRETP